MEAAAKREKEKQVIQEMISLYCRKQHHGQSLCKECQTLCRYAHQRIDCCPFMESKTFCSNCSVHCYQKERREQIRRVMRFSGPRMLLHRPIMVIQHMWLSVSYLCCWEPSVLCFLFCLRHRFCFFPPGALRKAPGAFTAGLSQQHFIKIIWIPLYSTAP